MIPRLPLFFAATLLLVASAQGQAVSDRVESHIRLLLGTRMRNSTLPTPLPNLFAKAGSGATGIILSDSPAADPAAPTAGPATTTPATETPPEPDVVARLASTLKFGGMLYRNGQPQLIINSSAYAVGALVPVQDGDTVHRLRLKSITRTHCVFELDGREATLSIR